MAKLGFRNGFILFVIAVPVLMVGRAQEYIPDEPISKLKKQQFGHMDLLDMLTRSADVFNDGIPISNVTDPCKADLVLFANQSSDFTRCLLDHARPFRMCEKCVEHFKRATILYQNLLTDKNCNALLLLADRMQVMSSVYKTFIDLWSEADCDGCFISVEENSTTGIVTFNFTADTIDFQNMHKNMSICVNGSAGWDWNERVKVPDDGNDTHPECTQCLSIYQALNSKFEDMRKRADGRVCMDLVDMMNYTRLTWSNKFKCKRPSADTNFIIISSCVLGFATLTLYLASRYISKLRMPKIFRGKRMAGLTQYSRVNQEGFTDASMRFPAPASPAPSSNNLR